jgi:hypothetical protein
MSRDDDMAKAKWVLVVGALFLISCFMCYDELAYQIGGHEAVATVTKAYASSSRRSTRQTVEYAWAEADGTQRRGMLTVDPSWAPPPDGKLAIRYTPGETGRSRLVGRVPWIWIAVFVGSVAGLGVFMFLMWREATEGDRPRRRSENRR